MYRNRSPAQVRCMRQVLRVGTLGRPRGIGWRGRWEGGSGWGIHVNPWLIHVNVWQKPLQYCKVISLQLIKINGKKELKERAVLITESLRDVSVSSDTSLIQFDPVLAVDLTHSHGSGFHRAEEVCSQQEVSKKMTCARIFR